MTAATMVVAGLLGAAVGVLANHAAGRFPWGSARLHEVVGPGTVAVRRPIVELCAGAMFVLVALRFGPAWELPAFLWFAGSGVLLTVIDLQHRLLPNRVLAPATGIGALLLAVAAAGEHDWAGLLRAGLGAAVLFTVFLVLALISPGGLGMGDVKLAGLLGLYLGWLGWSAVVVGAVAGFVVQALLAVVLLAGRRIGLHGELPFGPAMLVGAAVAIGWSDALG